MEEFFPILNETGEVVGKATRKECHSGSKILHGAVHLHLFNSKGEIYLQKRADWKDIQPGKWDTAVGGHIDYGEKPYDALLRECREELGLSGIEPQFLFSYIWESEREREMIFVHSFTKDIMPQPDGYEVSEGKFWTIEEVFSQLGKNIFTPNFEQEFPKIVESIQKDKR